MNRKSSTQIRDKSKAKNSFLESRSNSKECKLTKKTSEKFSQKKPNLKCSLNTSPIKSKSKSSLYSSCEKFQNPYNKVTRFDKIMNLKVKKPQPNQMKSRKNSYIEESMNSSLDSSMNRS